jgi:excisionase family DNA binding protein
MGSDALLHPVDDTCTILGIGKSQTWELIARGELESVKIGRRRLIPHDAIVDYVQRLRAEAAGPGDAPAA